MAVALGYGFESWAALKRHVKSLREADDGAGPDVQTGSTCQRAVELFHQLQNDDLYQRSQMWALMVMLQAAGKADADYATLMAVSGWSGQFVYHAKPDWPSFIEPCPTVDRACAAVGMGVELHSPRSPEDAFAFVRDALDADQPVLRQHYEFGIFAGRRDEGEPQVQYFVIPFHTDGVWWTMDQFRQAYGNPEDCGCGV